MKNNLSSFIFLVAVTASFSLGWIMHNPETLVVYNDTVRVQVVETQIVVTDTVTRVEILEVEVPFPIYVNYTEVHYIPTAMPLTDFPSEAVLMAWIRSDRTDKLDYDKRWTCMDFTLRTIRNAELDGYRIYFLYEQDKNHALTMAYVVDEAKYIIWEPQSDRVEWEWDSNQGG